MKFDKLVRDKIPEIITKDNKKAITHVAGNDEYEKRLRDKLKEESVEFYASGRIDELADVLEVIYALAEVKGTTVSKIEEIRKRKAEERGSFKERIVLDEVIR